MDFFRWIWSLGSQDGLVYGWFSAAFGLPNRPLRLQKRPRRAQKSTPEAEKSTLEALKSTPEAQKSTPGAVWGDFWCQKGSPNGPRSGPGSFSAAFLMTLGVEKGGKITQNHSKGRSGSENGDFFAKNAEVQQTLCFASPNGSPHDPESTDFSKNKQGL